MGISKKASYLATGCALSILLAALYYSPLQHSFPPAASDALTAVLALFATVAAYHSHVSLREAGDRWASRFLWMAVGLGMWVLGEAIWLAYGLASGELPAISIADVLWLAGYVPFAYGLYLTFSSLQLPKNAAFFAIIIYVLLTSASFAFLSNTIIDSLQPVEVNMVNIFYVLGDILLLELSIPLVLSYAMISRRISLLIIGLALAVGAMADATFFQLIQVAVPLASAATSFFYVMYYLWLGLASLVSVEEGLEAAPAPVRRPRNAWA